MNYRKRIMPGGKAVSKAQYEFYQKLLAECDPDDYMRRAALTKALQVDYDSLPERAGSLAPETPPKPKTPPRMETIKIGNRVACNLVRTSPLVFFLAKEDVWPKLHEAMPQVTRAQCLTLKEARSFMVVYLRTFYTDLNSLICKVWRQDPM
jgi:hypothetical protein